MGHGTEQEPTGTIDTERAERLAGVLDAVADPLRLRILTTLRTGPATPTDLAEALDLDETKVVEQLGRLAELGVVEHGDGGAAAAFALHDDHVGALLDEAIGHDAHRAEGLDDRASREL